MRAKNKPNFVRLSLCPWDRPAVSEKSTRFQRLNNQGQIFFLPPAEQVFGVGGCLLGSWALLYA